MRQADPKCRNTDEPMHVYTHMSEQRTHTHTQTLAIPLQESFLLLLFYFSFTKPLSPHDSQCVRAAGGGWFGG